jgi:hypothetical protein
MESYEKKKQDSTSGWDNAAMLSPGKEPKVNNGGLSPRTIKEIVE